MPDIQDFFANERLIMAATGGCAAAGTFLLLILLAQVYAAHKQASDEIIVTETQSSLIKAFLPTARTIGVILSGLFGGQKNTTMYFRMLNKTRQRLATAGSPEGINPEEFYGFSVLQGVLWMVIMLFLWYVLGESAVLPAWFYLFIGFTLGWFFWSSWLGNKIRQRQNSIRKSLPFALDILTLSMEAGLDFTGALTRLAQKMRGTPLGREFTLTLHEIQLGKTRTEALRDFSDRVDMTEVRTVVGSMIQAEELGASLGPILRIQSAQQRERRSQRAEEMAMKAPVKMLFPLIIVLMAMMATIAAPIVISYMNMEG